MTPDRNIDRKAKKANGGSYFTQIVVYDQPVFPGKFEAYFAVYQKDMMSLATAGVGKKFHGRIVQQGAEIYQHKNTGKTIAVHQVHINQKFFGRIRIIFF